MRLAHKEKIEENVIAFCLFYLYIILVLVHTQEYSVVGASKVPVFQDFELFPGSIISSFLKTLCLEDLDLSFPPCHYMLKDGSE